MTEVALPEVTVPSEIALMPASVINNFEVCLAAQEQSHSGLSIVNHKLEVAIPPYYLGGKQKIQTFIALELNKLLERYSDE